MREDLARARQFEAAEHALHAGLDGFIGLAPGFVDGGHDQVFEHLHVGLAAAEADDRRGIDVDLEQLLSCRSWSR